MCKVNEFKHSDSDSETRTDTLLAKNVFKSIDIPMWLMCSLLYRGECVGSVASHLNPTSKLSHHASVWSTSLFGGIVIFIYISGSLSATLIAVEIHMEGVKAATILHFNVLCYDRCN